MLWRIHKFAGIKLYLVLYFKSIVSLNFTNESDNFTFTCPPRPQNVMCRIQTKERERSCSHFTDKWWYYILHHLTIRRQRAGASIMQPPDWDIILTGDYNCTTGVALVSCHVTIHYVTVDVSPLRQCWLVRLSDTLNIIRWLRPTCHQHV